MPIQATRRMVTEGGLELRSDSETITVEGYASTFNQPYDMGWYQETVQRGAFTRTLKSNPDVRFLINHDGLPLARTNKDMISKGTATLELSEDSTGLHVRSSLAANDPDVQRIVPKMQRGDLNQMSFAFGIVGQEWDEAYQNRSLTELSLAGGDVSVVTYPANPNAGIALRMRQLVAEDPTKLRAIYAGIMEGRSAMSPETGARLTALLESIETTDDDGALVDLNDLIAASPVERSAEAVEVVAEPQGRSPQELRNLLALARRK